MKKQTQKKWTEKFKERKKWVKSNNYGITLIALVITVIVLLILAGISISMLSGDNSILSRATQAKTKTEYGKAQEALSLAYAEAVGDRYLNNSSAALEGEVVQKLQNEGYTIGTEASGSTQIELSSTSVTLEAGGNTEEVNAKIKTSTKYMLVDGLYYPLTITNNTATLGEEGKSSLTDSSSISLSGLTLNTTGSITATFNSTTGVITITSGSEISDNNKVEIVDNNGTKYGTINVAVISVIGDYVNYNVPYTDMYSDTDPNTDGLQGYNFTAIDGWRILSRTKNTTDQNKYDLKIISTGIPALLKYYRYDNPTNSRNANYEWWGSTEQVNSTYGLSLSSWSNGYSGYYAAYGLNNNFKFIYFDNGTNQSTENKGCWKNVNGKISGTGADFIASGFESETISVHNLSLQELNTARNLAPILTTSTAITDGDTGLFNLKNLINENSNFCYNANKIDYMLSNIGFGNDGSGDLLYVSTNGGFSNIMADLCGLRPVIEIKGVTMTQDQTSKVWTISQ